MKKGLALPLIIFLVVVIFDQGTKLWVKTNMVHDEVHYVQDWFQVHFVENPGMAFGWEIGGEYGKLALSLFRIFAVSIIGYYVFYLVGQKAPKGLIISLTLIFAGATGNILDSIFYGVMFSSSHHHVAELVPIGQGYENWFYGRVVDFLHFPIIKNQLVPEWIPFIGGNTFTFFKPIFNIADAAITVGVFLIIVFQRDYFSEEEEDKALEEESVSEELPSEATTT